MKLFRRKSDEVARRQRLRSADLQPGPSAYSYHARRSELEGNVGRQLQRESLPSHGWRRWQRLGPVGFIGSLIAVLIILQLLLGLATKPKVTVLHVGSAAFLLHDTTTYQSSAQKLLQTSLLNRNKLTVNTDKVSTELLKEHPELAVANISLPLIGSRPTLYIEPAQPALMLSAANGTYVLDTQGRALILRENIPAGTHLAIPTVVDQSNLHIKLNQQVLTAANVNFIQDVIAQLKAKGQTVSSLVLPPAASELDIHLAGQTYLVKFNLHETSARQQAGTLLATQAQLQKQHITPSQYIDVRVEGRAYYK